MARHWLMVGHLACTKRESVKHTTTLRTTKTRYQSRPTETHDEKTLRGRATLPHYDHARQMRAVRIDGHPCSGEGAAFRRPADQGWIQGERCGGCAGHSSVGTSP